MHAVLAPRRQRRWVLDETSEGMRSTIKGHAALWALLLFAPAWPGTAAAQTTSDDVRSVTVNIDVRDANVSTSNQRWQINLEDCRDLAAEYDQEIQFTWNFARTPPSGSQYTIKVIHDGETCNTSSLARESTDECDIIVQQSSLSGTRLDARLTWEEITEDTNTADCEGRRDIHDVTLIFDKLTTTTSDGEATDDTDFDQIRFEFRTTRPSAPGGLSARAGESTIRIDWDEVTGADSYDVFYSTEPLTAGARPEDLVASMRNTQSVGTTISEGIRANVTYYVAVSAVDEYDNASLLSEVVVTTTQPVTDFYEYYRQQGGADTGCAAAGSATGPAMPGWPWAAAAAIGLGSRRRRARSRA